MEILVLREMIELSVYVHIKPFAMIDTVHGYCGLVNYLLSLIRVWLITSTYWLNIQTNTDTGEVFTTCAVMKVRLMVIVLMLWQVELSMGAPSHQPSLEWAFGGTHVCFIF